MNRLKWLSAALVVLVVLWTSGATVELFFTTFSVGMDVTPSAVTVAVLAVALLAMIAVGARSRRWLANPDHYW